jgi:hypothetical protein
MEENVFIKTASMLNKHKTHLRQQEGNIQKPLIVALFCTSLLLNVPVPTSGFRKQSSKRTSTIWTTARMGNTVLMTSATTVLSSIFRSLLTRAPKRSLTHRDKKHTKSLTIQSHHHRISLRNSNLELLEAGG